MKMNLPVTGQEFDYDASQMLVSMTDLKGRVVHANDAFIAVSGFTREEILGKAHNIVRHPDMPAAAFADLWTTLQAGLPWTALVKNRRKTGDHYWVRANVTPVMTQGVVSSYLSVRTKPTRAEIDAAEDLYRDIREGRAKGIRIQGGRVVHAGMRGRVEAWGRMGLGTRIGLGMALCAAVPVAAALAGAGGMVTAGTAVVAGAATAAWLVHTVVRPLNTLKNAVHRLAAADLGVELRTRRDDQFGDIFRGLTQMAMNLRAVVQDVSHGAAVLTTATSEIASGNSDLSQRTETQAANLEQTAASMEQLNATVKTSATTARKATELAHTASDAATRGGQMMGQVVSTMDDIVESSNRIGVIISVIDGIAFQTNILALNAAVEAARAGEHGRGFAVVASEVRNLAQRSADAAREIKGLIAASVDKAAAGSTLVRSAGTTIEDIVDRVRGVAQLIDDISVATTEQTSGISQVNDAVGQLDQVTQQNAALVEEAAAAAESLNQQAARLLEAVSVFGTDQVVATQTIAKAQVSSKAAVAAHKSLPAPGPIVAKPLGVRPAPKALSTSSPVDDWESF